MGYVTEKPSRRRVVAVVALAVPFKPLERSSCTMAIMNDLLTRRRAVQLATASLSTLLLVSALPSAALGGAAAPVVRRRPDEPDWFDGAVDIRTSPSTVLDAVRNLGRWPTVFRDVASVDGVRQTGKRRTADVVSRVLGDHAHAFTLDDRGAAVDVYISVTGAETRGTFTVTPGADASSAKVTFSLLVRARGFGGIFVSESGLRAKQEAMVRTYLTDLTRLSPR